MYEFRIDGETFHLRVEGGAVEARQGAADAPDVVVSGGAGTFLALTAGRLAPEEALESGRIRVEGGTTRPWPGACGCSGRASATASRPAFGRPDGGV